LAISSRVPTQQNVAIHLLLLGTTKTGKSDYVARAANDGFTVLYIDSDNGANTLSRVLTPEGQSRVIYISTDKPYEFVKQFTKSAVMRWNVTRDSEFIGMATAKPDDDIIEIRPSRIQQGVIVAIDTWTSLSFDAMKAAAKGQGSDLADMQDKLGVYGDANIWLNLILDVMQKWPFHCIVQGHGTTYERKEKPPNTVNPKMKDMIIKDTTQIPVSSSAPHGASMGSKFNEIGWLEIDRFGKRILSFVPKYDRIGGGSVKGEGDPTTDYSFKKLFGDPIPYSEEDIGVWFKEFKASEFVAPTAQSVGLQKPATTPASSPAGQLPSSSAASKNPMMMALAKSKQQ
jgi:hypothetical protein